MEVGWHLDLAGPAALLVLLLVDSLGDLGLAGIALGVLSTVVDGQVNGSQSGHLCGQLQCPPGV